MNFFVAKIRHYKEKSVKTYKLTSHVDIRGIYQVTSVSCFYGRHINFNFTFTVTYPLVKSRSGPIFQQYKHEQVDGMCRSSGGKSAGIAWSSLALKKKKLAKTPEVLKVISHFVLAITVSGILKLTICWSWKSRSKSLGVNIAMISFVVKISKSAKVVQCILALALIDSHITFLLFLLLTIRSRSRSTIFAMHYSMENVKIYKGLSHISR